MRQLITKKQAVALVGQEEVQRVVRQNDTSLLKTGAKLFIKKQGCVWRFGVYGYTPDGRDVRQALSNV